jgi:hypothetical protein
MDYQTNAKIATRTVVNVTEMTQYYHLETTAIGRKQTLDSATLHFQHPPLYSERLGVALTD